MPTATLLPPFSPLRVTTEELHLRWADQRDEAAHEELVKRYQGLVRRLASRYGTRGDTFGDHLQVGNVGLLQALARFDPGSGRPFRAFAVPTIAGELRRHFRNTRWALHVPRGLQEDFLLVERATDSLSARLGRSPTSVELAAEVGLSEEAVLEAIVVRDGYDTLSLDAPAQASDGGEPVDLLDAIGRDEPRYDLTQSEIAERLGISQMLRLRFVDRIARSRAGRTRTVSSMT